MIERKVSKVTVPKEGLTVTFPEGTYYIVLERHFTDETKNQSSVWHSVGEWFEQESDAKLNADALTMDSALRRARGALVSGLPDNALFIMNEAIERMDEP